MAKTAAEQAEIHVYVIDSKGPTMSLGWQVLAAARARDEGSGTEEIIQKSAQVRDNLVQIVAMETLEYLKTGSRIGDAAKWVGNILNFKPIIFINHQTGRVEPIVLARTHKSAFNMLYKKLFDAINTDNHLRFIVLHGNALEEAQELAEQIRAEINPVELIINITGPILGVNTNTGALALCGYSESI